MSLVIDVKVIPSSGRQKILYDRSGRLKCYLKSPPEKGKANLELCRLLSKKLSIPLNYITIIFGASLRKKRIKINIDVSFEKFLDILGLERQMTI
ncbi:DUF167 domain-containing protein [Candidatus Babeliales bacterium]|nr:DUF167 domain-containing protein [Candidatus Babeliales bacterium]